MQKKTIVSLAESAVKDLENLKAWYSNQQVPGVGEKLLVEIITKIEGLSVHSEKGRIVPEFGLTNLRELIHPPFRIVYRLDKNRARVVRVWRSERMLKLP